jgi:hypothetical protein
MAIIPKRFFNSVVAIGCYLKVVKPFTPLLVSFTDKRSIAQATKLRSIAFFL